MQCGYLKAKASLASLLLSRTGLCLVYRTAQIKYNSQKNRKTRYIVFYVATNIFLKHKNKFVAALMLSHKLDFMRDFIL